MKTFLEWVDSDQSPSEARARNYFRIGHGDYSDEHGFEPDFHVWAHINGRVHKSPRYKVNPETGEANGAQTHGTLWGHDVTNRTYKGRYEPQTGRLSIVKPEHARFREVPNQVMKDLHRTFKNIKSVHEF